MLGAYGTPIFGGRGGRRGSAMAPLERATVVSYRLSIRYDTIEEINVDSKAEYTA